MVLLSLQQDWVTLDVRLECLMHWAKALAQMMRSVVVVAVTGEKACMD